ncbi:uncharacterized protein ACHHYP_04187 [Achlya hypogyna]|uniref:Transmembrane protein n=1 Tax=Achlya hypogyna TaxID=1202772 RepID=A0A1V9Z1P5_ACHHY|nr:uncharacterized protein ACHHYP_04187 [Achlya hypogyna]
MGSYWNESHAIRTREGLQRAIAAVVAFDEAQDRAQFEDQLVYISARLTGEGGRPILTDRHFGIAVAGVHLHRTVEMYQWREHRHDHTFTENGEEKKEVSYSYSEEWSATPIDSDSFDDRSYENPKLWLFGSKKTTHPALRLEGYALSQALVDAITTPQQPIPLNEHTLREMESVFALTLKDPQVDTLTATKELICTQSVDDIPALTDMFVHNDAAYVTRPRRNDPRPYRNAIGDLRVSFAVTPARRVSVLASPQHEVLVPYTSAHGVPIAMVQDGSVDADAMLGHAQSTLVLHSWYTWIRRLALLLLSCLGYYGVLEEYVGSVVRVPSAIGPLFLPVMEANRALVATLLGLALSMVVFAVGVTPLATVLLARPKKFGVD